MTEKEEKIVNYLTGMISTSIDKMENNAVNMLKFITGILTILTGLATYFKINAKLIIIPILFFIFGVLGFIKTIEPKEIKYIVGEIESCVSQYDDMVQYKRKWLKRGYYFSYIGFIFFILIILA